MLARAILAAVLAAGAAGIALAEVQVKAPGVEAQAPSGGVDLNVDVGSKIAPTEAWVGRSVYSSDGTKVGEVSAISGDKVYADISGFLGLGETRVLLSTDQIAHVADDRIDLTLTEAQTDNLPAVDKKPDVTK
jgi:PRC-barrel domain